MSREFLMLHEESSYGTVTLTGGAPTTGRFMYVRLADGNAFAARPKPMRYEIPNGQGLAIAGLTGADSYEIRGQLRTQLYYSQANRFLKWGIARINSGRTVPWTTTDASNLMPAGDIASISAYHAVQRNDGTYKRRRYPGGKVASWRIECSRQSPVAMLTLDLVFSGMQGSTIDSSSDPDATAFPAPTDAQYPTDPVLFSHSSTGLKIGSTRSLYESISLSGTNKIDPKWFEGKFPQSIRFFGRETTLESRLLYKVTPDDRTALETVTVQDCEVTWTNATNTIKIDYQGKNYFDDVQDDLPLDATYMQQVRLKNYYDVAVGGDQPDVAITYT
jgi:hypothetical protein